MDKHLVIHLKVFSVFFHQSNSTLLVSADVSKEINLKSFTFSRKAALPLVYMYTAVDFEQSRIGNV